MILYDSWELNESLGKIVFGHKTNRLHMHRSNPVTIDCFVCLALCILEKCEKSYSSQFHELLVMVLLFFNGSNCQFQKFFSHMKTLRVKHKIPPSPLTTLI